MIVSDATTLITLIKIKEFHLLQQFTPSITIPPEIYNEISTQYEAKQFLDKQINNQFISIGEYTNSTLFSEFNLLLDKGESAAITLAIENNLPLIIDEKKGRKFAKAANVKIIGLVGIIRFLYINNKIGTEYTQNLLDKLHHSDFRISQKLLDMILYKPV